MEKSPLREGWSDDTLIERALAAKTERTYWNNVNALRSRASKSLYQRALALTHSASPKERALGADVLCQLYSRDPQKHGLRRWYVKSALQRLLDMLSVDQDTDTLISILHGIGHCNTGIRSKDIRLLLPYVGAADPNVRYATVFALTGIEHPSAINGLIELSSDKHSRIRNWATFGIGTISDLDSEVIRRALLARCADRHGDTRMEGVRGLAKRKDIRVRPFLERAFAADCTVLVLESICDLGAGEYLPRLMALEEEVAHEQDVDSYWLRVLKESIACLRDGQPA